MEEGFPKPKNQPASQGILEQNYLKSKGICKKVCSEAAILKLFGIWILYALKIYWRPPIWVISIDIYHIGNSNRKKIKYFIHF